MRRTIPFVVAVVAAIVAVLGVMVGVGIGQTISSPGGTPSDVYTQTWEGGYCADITLNGGGRTVFEQWFKLEAESNVVVYFSFEFGFETPRQQALITFGLDGHETNQDWSIPAAPNTSRNIFGNALSTTLMWTFDHVDAGDHSVQAFALVSPGVAGMNGCAFTVLVSPVAE